MTDNAPQIMPGLSSEELKKLSDHVGYDLSKFSPKPLPSDIISKLPLVIWSAIVLLAPFLLVGFGKEVGFEGHTNFLIGGVTIMAINFGVLEYVRNEIYTIRKEWEKAVSAVRASTGDKACEAAYRTIENFRFLTDWLYSTRYLTIPFLVFYIGLIFYALYCSMSVVGAVFGFTSAPTFFLPVFFDGPTAILVFLYYWLAFGLRQWILLRIFSYTANIDPSLQICAALAEIYKRFEEVSVGRRLSAGPS